MKTNKYVFDNGYIVDDYPCDLDGVKYLIHTSWEGDLVNPDYLAQKEK